MGRLVEEGGAWLKAKLAAEESLDKIAPQVISAFVPSAADKEWLSLYAIADEAEAELLAAALRYNQGNIVACHFATADTSHLEALGIAIRKTAGTTYHPWANDRHYEIHIPDLGGLTRALQAFAAGPYFRVEQPTVLTCLQTSAVEGKIDIDALVEPTKINGQVATRTMELVKTSHLQLSPAT
ncbi:hypothetical protein [Sphingobium agri]|uniref:hypothetical protein n=1 Tax=Sphingobium TaxID=165695 RepID=UPI001FF3B3F7|nr:hypothetical protein [Sphingobium agri]